MTGATLANGSRSGAAVAAYQKALELKPNYMRAWANMGISQANLGNYDASARFYIRALGLNPGCGKTIALQESHCRTHPSSLVVHHEAPAHAMRASISFLPGSCQVV